MTTHKAQNNHISDLDIFTIYKEMERKGKIETNSFPWERMNILEKRLQSKNDRRWRRYLKKQNKEGKK